MKITELLEEIDSPNTRVYVDMDGVLVDTYNHISKILGIPHYNQITPAQWEEFYSKVDGYELFKDLPIFPTANALLEIIKKYSKTYHLLSSPLNYDVAGSTRGKIYWLKNHTFINPASVTFESAKEKYAVSNGVPNILIDDSASQLQRWKAAGGIAIKYQADVDSVSGVEQQLKKYLT
jgi:5'(3')-deoxyribonucleotidase